MEFIALHKSTIPGTLMICYSSLQVSPGIRLLYIYTSFCTPLQIPQFQPQPFISEQLQRPALTLWLYSLVTPPNLIPDPASCGPSQHQLQINHYSYKLVLSNWNCTLSKVTSGHDSQGLRRIPYNANQSNYTVIRSRKKKKGKGTHTTKTGANINTWSHNHPEHRCLDASVKAQSLTSKITCLFQNRVTLLQ